MDPRIHDLLLKAQIHGSYPRNDNIPPFRGGVIAGGSGIKYIDFVKNWHSQNPQYSWKQAMELASKDYELMKHGGSADLVINPTYHRLPYGGYGTKAGAKKAVKTKRKKNELHSEALKGVRTKLMRGEIMHAPSIGMGYGTQTGARKAVKTKLMRGEIMHAPSLGMGYGTRAGARKAVKTKKKRHELESETLKGVRTKLLRGEIMHAPSIGMGENVYCTTLPHSGIQMGGVVCPYCANGGCDHCFGMGVLAGEGILYGGVRKVKKKPKKLMKGGDAKNKMAAQKNPWIKFLKSYSKKIGYEYNEVLKDPRLRIGAEKEYCRINNLNASSKRSCGVKGKGKPYKRKIKRMPYMVYD